MTLVILSWSGVEGVRDLLTPLPLLLLGLLLRLLLRLWLLRERGLTRGLRERGLMRGLLLRLLLLVTDRGDLLTLLDRVLLLVRLLLRVWLLVLLLLRLRLIE